MIALIDGVLGLSTKKWFDIEITNRWPIISLTDPTNTVIRGNSLRALSGYQHLSILPDLRLHLSGPAGKIYFDAVEAWNVRDGRTAFHHWFTCAGKTFRNIEPLTTGKSRQWDQAAIMSPFRDVSFDPDRTRATVEFFLHTKDVSSSAVKYDLTVPGMRLSYDRTGCTLGPFPLGQLQRRVSPPEDLLFTLRFGYVELDRTEGMYLYVNAREFTYPIT